MTEDCTPEDRMASFRASSQRAVAALEAVAACAQTALWQASSLPAGADPERDHERSSRVLCPVRHPSGQFSGLRFHQIRGTADELCIWARTAVPGSSAGAEEPYCDLDIDGDATARSARGYRSSSPTPTPASRQASTARPPLAIRPHRIQELPLAAASIPRKPERPHPRTQPAQHGSATPWP
jgi:hypothetical protein